MARSKPTFVFVPGAMHTPAFYHRTINALQALDYPCNCVSLPNVGVGAESAGPKDDVIETRKEVQKLVLQHHREVVLVGHSWGGVVASQAVKGLERSTLAAKNEAGGIIRVTFVTALLLDEGQTLSMPPVVVPFMRFDENLTRPGPTDANVDGFFHDLPRKEAEHYAKKLKVMDMHRFSTPVNHTCWDSDVPKTYIHTTQDHALPVDWQKYMLGAIKDDTWKVYSINSGHCPFLSRVDETVKLLIKDV